MNFEKDKNTNEEYLPQKKEEVVGAEQKVEQGKINPELRKFSKRYASKLRDDLAYKLKNLRAEARQELASVHEENQERAGKKEEIHSDIENIKKEIEVIKEEIEVAKSAIEKEKNSFMGKILEKFRLRDIEKKLGMSELTQKRDNLLQKKKEYEDSLGDFDEIVASEDVINAAQSELRFFYDDMSDKKSKFESQEEQRDIERISRDHNALFVHMIGNNGYGGRGEKLTFGDGFDLIDGVRPTLSTSTITPEDMRVFGSNTMYYNAGVILGRGRVLTTRNESLRPKGFFTRESNTGSFGNGIEMNYDDDVSDERMQKIIEKKEDFQDNKGRVISFGDFYNELSVENPEPKAILLEYMPETGREISINNSSESTLQLEERKLVIMSYVDIIKSSDQTNLPIITKKDGKLYKNAFKGLLYTTDRKEWNEVTDDSDISSLLEQRYISFIPKYDFEEEVTISEVNEMETKSSSDAERKLRVSNLLEKGLFGKSKREIEEVLKDLEVKE